MKTKRSKNHIRARLYNRTWAVRLSVNGEPVNHPGHELGAAVVNYYPVPGEKRDHALKRFANAVNQAARRSLFGTVILNLAFVREYHHRAVERLATLLAGGGGLVMYPHNLIVNLWLDENDPATAEVVERIVGESAGGTVAGMSKMPVHQPGRKEDRARPASTGSPRRARPQLTHHSLLSLFPREIEP